MRAASTGTYTCFTGGADGRVVKWERWQINHFIYTSESYPCDINDPAFIDAYDIHVVHRKGAIGKRRLASAPADARRQGSTSVKAQHWMKNSITASLFADGLDVLVLGGQDSHIYVWGFDETDAFMAESSDSMRVRSCSVRVDGDLRPCRRL